MPAVSLDPAALAPRTEAALASRHPGCAVTEVEQIIGGSSSLTFTAIVRSSNLVEQKVVIKVAPPGLEPTRNRDVLRQVPVLSLLGGVNGIAVPEVLGSDGGAPPDVPPFYVMAFAEGESHEPLLSPTPSDATPAEVRSRAFAAAGMAARLHAVDATAGALDGEPVIDLHAEVDRWARAFRTVDEQLRTGAESVAARLLETVPASLDASILHGDWRLGNMLCRADAIRAVIDWEIWSLGDRRNDLAWFLLITDERHPRRVRDDGHLPNRTELIAAYEEASGRRVVDLEWFEALVRFKHAAVAALITKNTRKLPQPGVDSRHTAAAVPALLRWAASLL